MAPGSRADVSACPPGPDASVWRHVYAGRRVLVLGATGFIGPWLVRALGRIGAEPYLVVRNGATARPRLARYGAAGELLECDLLDPSACGDLVNRVRPVIVFNLAAYGVDRSERDPAAFTATNVELVRQLCVAVSASRCPGWPGQDIVHAGSGAEYGAFDGLLTEEIVPRPKGQYGETKLAGTQVLMEACRTTGMRGVTARLFSVYGPGDASGRLLPAIVEAAHAGTSVRLTPGDQRRDFTYVEDVAEGLLRLGAARPLGGDPVNLSTGSLVSVRVFAEIAAAVLGMSATALDFGVLPVRPDEVAYRSVDVSRLRALTGWTPATSVREGIRRTVELELERRSDWAGRPR